jgi:hypothetical protein
MWLMVGPVAPLPGPIMRQYQGLRDEGDGHPLEAISGSVPRCCGLLERIAALGRWSDAGILFVDTARPRTVGAEIARAAAWDTDQGHFGKLDIVTGPQRCFHDIGCSTYQEDGP